MLFSELDGQRSGVIFYGVSGSMAYPIGNGVMCVAPPRQRTGTRTATGTLGACDGTLGIDWLAYIAADPAPFGAPLFAGELVWVQAWWRDPQAPTGTALSPGLQFTLASGTAPP